MKLLRMRERLSLAQLSQRLRLDLANTFARDGEQFANFFESAVEPLPDAKAHPHDLLFAWRQRRQDLARQLAKIVPDRRLDRCGASDPQLSRRASLAPRHRAGIFSEIGSLTILSACWTFPSGISICSASSSGAGWRPRRCTNRNVARCSLLTVSTMWTGIRMVRLWSASARDSACRIHHVA